MPDPTPDEAAVLLRVAEQQLDQWKAECRALEARLAAQQPVIDAAVTWYVEDPADRDIDLEQAIVKYRAASGSVEADTPAEPDAAEVAALLRACAAGRREYAENAAPHAVETLAQEAATFDTAAALVEGNYAPLYGLLPSWRWTDAMEARVRGWRGTATTWADVASIAGAAPEREVPGTPAAEPAPARPGTCSTCDSSQPHLHPSADLCPDPWHKPVPTTVEGWRREVARWANLLEHISEYEIGNGALDRVSGDMIRALAGSADDTREDGHG